MSVPTHQTIWNRHLHIANAFGEHVDLARYVIEVDVTHDNGTAYVRIRKPLEADGERFVLPATVAQDYQACRRIAAQIAPRFT